MSLKHDLPLGRLTKSENLIHGPSIIHLYSPDVSLTIKLNDGSLLILTPLRNQVTLSNCLGIGMQDKVTSTPERIWLSIYLEHLLGSGSSFINNSSKTVAVIPTWDQ